MKKLISVLICILMLLGSFSTVTLAEAEIWFDIEPSVFLCGDIYNVVWTNNCASVGLVTYTVDGVTHTVYDEEGGIVRTDDYAHTVSIPVDELDAAGAYTVRAIKVNSRSASTVDYGDSCETSRTFHGYEEQEEINIWTISDTHLDPDNFSARSKNIKRAADNLKGGDPDLVMLLGDIADDVPSKHAAIISVFGIADVLSNGNVPCVYTRGNHETRGEFSGYLLQYFPSDTGEFYFTFDYGPMTSIVLDYGEDKFDAHYEYGGLTNYNNYRDIQTEWLTSIESYDNPDATYRIAFCHGPDVNSHFGHNWTSELDRLGTDIMVAGHVHYTNLITDTSNSYYGGFPLLIDGVNNSNSTSEVTQLLLKDGNIECYATNQDGTALSAGIGNITAGQNPPTTTVLKGSAKTEEVTVTNAGLSDAATLGDPEFAIITKPTVFDTGDTYTVAWATTEGKNSSGEVYVNHNGKEMRFSDDESGTLRCLSNIHAVKIPKEYLTGNSYKIVSRHVITHAAYGRDDVFGPTVTTGYIDFTGYSGQSEINMAVLSDTASDDTAFYKLKNSGKAFDVLVLTGNTVAYAETSHDVIDGLLVNTGTLTNGQIPVIFSRGSNETKGEYAPYLSWLVRNSTRQFYEIVEYGPITTAVLDTSGLVPDDAEELGGLSCFASVREKQQLWLDSIDYGDATYKLAITSVPRIHNLVGHNFARSLNTLGTDLAICSGSGTSGSSAIATNGQNYATVLNGSYYGDGTVATLINFKDGVITASVLTDSDCKQTASFNVSDNDITTYTDVNSEKWYAEAVGYASTQRILIGVSETKFAPESTVTRGMAVTALANLDCADLTKETAASFTDVKQTAYYAKPITWAKNNDIVYGVSETEFAPLEEITREQLCTILYRAYGDFFDSKEILYDGLPKDIDNVSEYAKDAVIALYRSGIIVGMGDGTFSPKTSITRAMLAQILYKANINVQITDSSIGQ